MEITEYITKRAELKKLIDEKKHELANLKNNYLKEHCPFKTGDKVKIETPEYVSSNWCDRGKVIPAQTQ